MAGTKPREHEVREKGSLLGRALSKDVNKGGFAASLNHCHKLVKE